MHVMCQQDLNWAAMRLSGVFTTTDGAIVLVGAFKQNPLLYMCTALGIDDLSVEHPNLENPVFAQGQIAAGFSR